MCADGPADDLGGTGLQLAADQKLAGLIVMSGIILFD